MSRTDSDSTLEDMIQAAGVNYQIGGHHHNVRSGWLGLDCPFCETSDGKFYLGIHLRKHYVNCWRCGPHRLGDTLAAILGIPVGEAIGLAKKLPRGEASLRRDERIVGKYKAPPTVEMMKAHRRYLKQRKFDPDELTVLWKLEGTDWRAGPYAWRIFIPVIEYGKTRSWTTRAIDEEVVPRYRAAEPQNEAIPIRDLIYGSDYCRHAIIVHEGPTDVWRIGPGATCTFGVGYSPEQLRRIAEFPIRIVCFDNEKDAQNRADVLCSTLSIYPGETFNVRLDSPDPGSATKREIKRLRSYLL
jgi:hypothetical protein